MTVQTEQGQGRLQGYVVVVTGGSSGIGAAIVRAFAEEGAILVIGYNQGNERAEALRASLPGKGHVARQIPLDDAEAHESLFRDLERDFGKIDVLVNSAGYTKRIAHKNLAELSSALFNEMLAINVGGPYSVTRALIGLLERSGSATVINISSVSGFTGLGSNIAYCAAKAALDTMTVSLARAFGPDIRFLSLAPAAVDTGFVTGRSREELEKKAAQTPLGRVVEPEDVALAALACVTHLRTATGTRIVIDGGHTL
ncbi:SDR family NAD(P)-dependent oxidoreductase [Paraburkholderia acidiphila]|uniref:SDR family oxidoreductase n=1 Tax=Paraburkholderia acidiphila TaxID=2571747 RepID=A0A7Z2G7Z1_9BURK|nr:SDR family oxidoreductase [Paraburkholderia acidiphila]QGZ56880.1 SDR family oxidoreductase [Paraburkholderia acidiphila]